MTTEIMPSAEARQLYSMMVNRAEEDDGELHLTLAHSIELTCTLNRAGCASAGTAVMELRQADWIAPAPHGGWKVG